MPLRLPRPVSERRAGQVKSSTVTEEGCEQGLRTIPEGGPWEGFGDGQRHG